MIRAIRAFVKDYLVRHRNNVDRLLHIIGVPMAFFGLYQVIVGSWREGLLKLFIGYLLQWIGHTYFEKNEVGEWILIKAIIRKIKGR